MALHSITRGCISLALTAGLAGLTNPASATVLKVDIDTSSLTGTGTAQLAFDLTDGDGVANNTITTAASGGTLSGNWTLIDTSFFNELLLPVTLGNLISFTLNLTENYAGSPFLPDQLALFLVDSTTSMPLFTTSDPTGADALFAIDLGVTDGLQPYQPTSIFTATWTVTNATIPEPGVLLLFGSGLLGLAGRRWR